MAIQNYCFYFNRHVQNTKPTKDYKNEKKLNRLFLFIYNYANTVITFNQKMRSVL